MKAEGVSCYHIEDLQVDVDRHEVRLHGKPVELPELSFRLLCRLCDQAPEVVSKDEIANSVWKREAVSDETIAQRIRLLRKALGDNSGARIVSVRGIGYRLGSPVTVSAPRGLRGPVLNVDAYNAYLLGRHFAFEHTVSDLERAVQYLEQAVSLEPEFAEAYCALGWAWCFLGSEYGNRVPGDVFQRAKSAALRAVSLAPGSADAHSLLADILCWYDWDFAFAEKEHRLAVSIDPGMSLGYALMLSSLERHEEAIELVERRLRITPDDTYVRANVAWRYLDAGRFEDACNMAATCGKRVDALSVKGIALLCMGRIEDAIDILRRDLENDPGDPSRIANLARACAARGLNDEAVALDRQLKALSERRYVSPWIQAISAFAVGENDRGFELLESAFDHRAREMIFLRVSTALNDVRDDPRYQSLVRRVGLG